MNREEILYRLKELNFDPKEYWVITGSAMVLYGFRDETGDIDLGCTPKLAEHLQSHGYPVTHSKDGTRKITVGEDVEIFENWLYDSIQLLDGIPVISLNGLVEMKKSLGREKDLRDIQLIEHFSK